MKTIRKLVIAVLAVRFYRFCYKIWQFVVECFAIGFADKMIKEMFDV